jgi:GT2 family glycosyltransferase
MSTPLVSIVILNWNGRKFLQQFLPSVVAGTWASQQIVVIDNASTDDSVLFVKENYPSIKVIQLSSNLGYAGGYNEGLKQVQSDYYVLLNSDVEVTPGWIEPVIALMEADKTIAICQPKLLQYDDKRRFEYAGAAGGWIDYLGFPFARGRIFNICEEDEGQYDTPAPVFWASGAALFIRSTVFHELQGFDNWLFAHQEEIDLCWRAQLAGYKIYACPQSVVYHVGAGTLHKESARKVYLNFRNNLVIMAKNMSAGEAIWKIFLRFWLNGLFAWKALFTGQGAHFWAVCKAHIGFFGWLFTGRKKSVFPAAKKGVLQGYLHKSVVWSHFARGKKKFSEIVG